MCRLGNTSSSAMGRGGGLRGWGGGFRVFWGIRGRVVNKIVSKMKWKNIAQGQGVLFRGYEAPRDKLLIIQC